MLQNQLPLTNKPDLIVVPEGKICDYIDQKFRNDSPEEYVRQTIEKRLVNEHKYLKERIKVEFTIHTGASKPRIDLAIFKKDATSFTPENIYIIVECKKETVEPQNRKDGVGQLISYMSACANCEWGMWTNGINKIVLRKVTNERGELEFPEWNDIPSADGSTEDIDRPKRTTLKRAVEDNLLFVFRTCHNHIYAMDGLHKDKAFFEFLKIIFCKIEDEKNAPNPLEFYTTSKERSNSDGQLSVKNRIGEIFNRVKNKYGRIFTTNDEILLSPRSLAYVISELQRYSLLNTNIDIKGRAYEEIVGSNLRGDRGEFFTPRNIMTMTVEMLAPRRDERVCDPSCGTGGFLVTAMTHVIKKLKAEMQNDLGKLENEWTFEEQALFRARISEIAAENYFGFDLNPDLVKATKMNMVMNNDGSGNILQTNSLLPPHEWTAEFKSKLAVALRITPEEIRNHRSIEFFDVIVTNPPFGSNIPILDHQILEQYELGHNWKKREGEWHKTDALQGSVPPEQLFVERCLQLLKPGGRLGIVLPDSILGNPNLGYMRSWLIANTHIIASVDLHADTFQPFTGVQTSILILQKKTKDEIAEVEKSRMRRDDNIFMAMVEKVGHDKRGNLVFKRDEYGNELLTDEDSDVIALGATASGARTATSVSKVKIIDDQTLEVPKIFGRWKQQEGFSW